jgi:hypothetical protein
LQQQLADFPIITGPLADALTAADQTIGPGGRAMPFEQRIHDTLARHSRQPAYTRAHPERERHLRAVTRRVALRLQRAGRNPATFGLAW